MSAKPNIQSVEGRNPGSVGQINQQLDEAKALRESQMQTVDELQSSLFAGDINQKQYDASIGALFDAQLAQLQGDKAEQGDMAAAAGIPVGQGVEGTIAGQGPVEDTGSPFAPPQGVNLSGGSELGGPAPSGDEAFLAGPTKRPNEHITTGANPMGRAPVPAEVYSYLPYLVDAAKQPNAPASLVELVRYLNYHMSR